MSEKKVVCSKKSVKRGRGRLKNKPKIPKGTQATSVKRVPRKRTLSPL